VLIDQLPKDTSKQKSINNLIDAITGSLNQGNSFLQDSNDKFAAASLYIPQAMTQTKYRGYTYEVKNQEWIMDALFYGGTVLFIRFMYRAPIIRLI